MSDLTPDTRAKRKELIVGSLLLAFAVAWTGTVYFTVPTGHGTGIGPRAFPLALGLLLTFLSALLVLTALRGMQGPEEEVDDEFADLAPVPLVVRLRIIVSVAVLVGAYGYLMQNAGFVLATAGIVAVTMWFVIGVRRPLLVIGMSAGITAGCWFAFGQVLGAYIPRGTWINSLF